MTVLFLIFPYVIFTNYYFCLGFTLFNAMIVILIFTFYVSVTRASHSGRGFLRWRSVSFGIATLTFLIAFFVKMFLKIDL